MTDAKISSIGKYRIIELIGEGAMGVVYKALDTVLDRTVAIKVMNQSIAQQEDLRKRFLREAQAAGSLQHPNVVCIHDFGEMDGHLFIAMEFIDGVDLERLVALREPPSLKTRLDIMIDVLTGLAYAHKRGIVHRDIKPANIRVCEDGRAKVLDFGVAHLASSSMTSTGSILGTPTYMAPEQITEGKTSAATDIFAVGGVLYQILTLMKPFDAPNVQNLLFRIVTENPRPISELVPGLPPALDHIVRKAMAKEPSDRYANALEMANDLTNVRSSLSGPSHSASVPLRGSVASANKQPRRNSSMQTKKLAYWGGGALAGAAIIAIAWWQLAQRGSARLEAAGTTAPAVTPASPQVAPASISTAAAKTETLTLPAQPASVCGNNPHCFEAPTFVATVTDMRESVIPGAFPLRVVGLTVRFRNATSGPLILGYVIGSGVVTDDLGNRYTIKSNGVRGLGQVSSGQVDRSSPFGPGRAATGDSNLSGSPGARCLAPSSTPSWRSARSNRSLAATSGGWGGSMHSSSAGSVSRRLPPFRQKCPDMVRVSSPSYSPAGAASGSS